jgi:hypothetical protein
MCPRGDLNTKSRAFPPIPRLNTQVGEKSPVRGFHALTLAGTPRPVSRGLVAAPGPRAPSPAGLPRARTVSLGAPGRLRQSACRPMGASQR